MAKKRKRDSMGSGVEKGIKSNEHNYSNQGVFAKIDNVIKSNLLVVIIIFCISGFSYIPSLFNDFVWDDKSMEKSFMERPPSYHILDRIFPLKGSNLVKKEYRNKRRPSRISLQAFICNFDN